MPLPFRRRPAVPAPRPAVAPGEAVFSRLIDSMTTAQLVAAGLSVLEAEEVTR